MADEQKNLSGDRKWACRSRGVSKRLRSSRGIEFRHGPRRFEKLLNGRPHRTKGLVFIPALAEKRAWQAATGRVIVPFVRHRSTPSSICITIVSRDVSRGEVGSVREYTTTAGSQPFFHRWEPLNRGATISQPQKRLQINMPLLLRVYYERAAI